MDKSTFFSTERNAFRTAQPVRVYHEPRKSRRVQDLYSASVPPRIPKDNAGLSRSVVDKEAALESYHRAIALTPEDALSHYNRAAVLRELGRQEEALESYLRKPSPSRSIISKRIATADSCSPK